MKLDKDGFWTIRSQTLQQNCFGHPVKPELLYVKSQKIPIFSIQEG